ncbi:MAG: LppX_LprAFG lipoprotein [Chloroflexota bacterium]
MRIFRMRALGTVIIVMVMALAACSATPTEAPLPDPQTLLNKAATEVQNAKSIKIKLQLTGAPSYVDPPLTLGGPGNSIAFISADGAYVAPDRVSASVVASILGIPGKVDVTAIGDDQWMKNQILTAGRWVKRIFSPGFNAAKLISSDSGIQSALRALKDLKVVGRENIDGVQMYHVTGNAAGADISALTVGLIRGSDVIVDIYIPIDTGRVDRVIMVQPETVTPKEPKPTTWTLELFDYNSDEQIAAPDLGDTVATAQATIPVTVDSGMLATSEATQAK